MEGEFDRKVVLVTGGSCGIGLATAKLLSLKGANVWTIARHHDHLQSALSQVESSRRSSDQLCGAVSADVTNVDDITRAVAEITRNCGAPDILINSAGDVHPELFQDTHLDVIRQLMELNYFGTVNTIQACLPSMVARRSGHIVNISSVYGFVGGYGYSAYCASKFAVRGFSDALRAELKPLGIGVSIVFPQNTDTPQLARENKLKSPLLKAMDNTRVMTAEDVAKVIVRGISRRQYVIIPGTEGKFLFWMTGILGTGTYRVIDRLVMGAQKKAEKVIS
jgi:3-dehydrosphinganine reductase